MNDQWPAVSVSELMDQLPTGDGLIGFDLEADSLYRYSERICLIQVCYEGEVVLLDPLGEDDLTPFIERLRGSNVWLHGADYDMALMLREWGFCPPVIYDTQIGAQLLGHERFGYASLVESYFGVELSKSSQKADWGKRPLSERMLEYACNDVLYLLPLATKIKQGLEEKGRYGWFLESCEAARERVLVRDLEEREQWRIGGSGKLRPRGLSFLKALWEWRDAEAADWNKPSFMVATNKNLIAWAETLAGGGRVGFPPKMRSSRLKRLKEAISRARDEPEAHWPKRPKRERFQRDDSFEDRLRVALSKRNETAEQLGLDPSLIASRPVMEQIVGGRAEPEEILLRWQRDLLNL